MDVRKKFIPDEDQAGAGIWRELSHSDVDNIKKFLLYENKETKDRLLLCGGGYNVRYHKDIPPLYTEGNLEEDYTMIGAGTFRMGSLEILNSSHYEFDTSKEVSIDVIKYLWDPFLGSSVQSFMDNDSRTTYP